MSVLDNLPHLCTAKRRTRTKDALGGSKDSFPVTLFTDRACWRQPANASEVLEYQQRNQNVTHKIYFTSDPVLDERCIIEIGTDVMSVRSVSQKDASVGLGVVWRVMVELEP